MDVVIWLVAFFCSIAALVQAYWFYQWMMKCDEGNEDDADHRLSSSRRCRCLLAQQYRVVFVVFIAIAILLAVAAYGFDLQSKFVPIAFLTGGFFSGLSGWLGMKTATQASSRTAQAARTSLNQGLASRLSQRCGAGTDRGRIGIGLYHDLVCTAVLGLAYAWPVRITHFHWKPFP